ncbi:4-hydroxybenzoate octaprenyltransferase [Ectothiorhodospira lacustris]|uniref:4-hydroxybenzoate octaprenyltransferase n=1 Tax=Ectothiorhodospira lacustris TaxID=2899127 RepID=UPI001EE8AEFD|nr:4-hydroxybenzoate octaprenyltransferase [Ectothiorhodospira lacustris]MCG5509789.1 4-hydroxybenzoate octaprenyltransferase [Ectothiorhodospira lacustris]MCG5522297.1 4-hydroxybenzoate octaprenyltransferase [Ectothiorhodospira lacustris]
MKPVNPDTAAAPLNLRDRLVQYALLTRLHRPIGILLLLWPTLWALWIAAEGMPDLLILFVFVAGVALMRSAGCAINDFADRDIDGHVSRTRDRPLASRRISGREAVGVTVALSLTAFALVLLMNPLTIALSVVALALAVSYPFMKRFHHLPQVHLGAAFGWAVPMAFAAQTGAFPPPLAWLLFLATILWTTAYDTMYAMVDRPDDLKIGVKSSAILFGEADRLIIGILQALTLVALALVGLQAGLGGFFYLGLGIAALLALYQQYLIHGRDPGGCFQAFLNNNWFGLAIFAGIIGAYLFGAG